MVYNNAAGNPGKPERELRQLRMSLKKLRKRTAGNPGKPERELRPGRLPIHPFVQDMLMPETPANPKGN